MQISLALLVYVGVTVFNEQPDYDYFKISILITVIAAFMENLSEPYYVVMLLNMEFSHRAKAESVSIFVKSILIYGLVYQGYGLLAYAVAQLMYALTMFCIYTVMNSLSQSKNLS